MAPFGIKPGSKVLDLYNARPQTSTHTEDVKAAIGFINDHPVRFPGIWNRNTSDPETAELRPVLAALDRARHHHQGAELGTPPAHEVPECTESTSLGQSHTESRSIVRPIDHASIVADDGSGLSFQLKPEHEELLELASKVKASTGVETDDSAADKDSTYTGSSSPVQSKSEALSIIQAIDRVTTLTDNESRYSFELEPEHEEPLTSPQEAKLFKPVLSIPAEIDHSKHPAFLANHAEDDESIEPQADSPTLGAGSSQDAWWIAGTDAQHENLEGHIPASKPPPLNVQKGKDKSDSRHKASDFNTLTSYRNPRSVEVSEPTITTNIQALESTLSDKEVSKILQKTKPAAGPVAFTPDREITPVSKGKGTTPSKSNKLNTCTQSSLQQNTLQSVSDREPGNDSCTPYTSKMVSSKTTPTRKRFLNSIKTSITTPLASRFSFGSPTNTTTVTPSTPGVLSPATQYFQRFPIDVRSPKDDLDTYARRSQSPQRLRRALDQVDDATKDNICKREVSLEQATTCHPSCWPNRFHRSRESARTQAQGRSTMTRPTLVSITFSTQTISAYGNPRISVASSTMTTASAADRHAVHTWARPRLLKLAHRFLMKKLLLPRSFRISGPGTLSAMRCLHS